MKKIYLILSFVFAITAVIGTANATVKKCVPLVDGNQTTCTSDPSLYENYIDWAAKCKCTTNGVTSEINGIAACSNKQPELCANGNCDWTYADPTMRQQTIPTNGAGAFCWCKMTSPAVSLWVFRSGYVGGDPGDCAMHCAADCANFVRDAGPKGAAFRSALFSGMGE